MEVNINYSVLKDILILFTLINTYDIIFIGGEKVNIKPKQFTKVISLRLNKQEYETVLSKFQKKKTDKLSANLKNYLFSKIKEEPVIEYSIRQKKDKMEVTIWENGIECDSLLYDSIEQARKYVRSINAVKIK